MYKRGSLGRAITNQRHRQQHKAQIKRGKGRQMSSGKAMSIKINGWHMYACKGARATQGQMWGRGMCVCVKGNVSKCGD